MTSSSPNKEVERARPLLGTTVNIRATAPSEVLAHAAISEAFEAVARVHRLMSFHEEGSDLSRLHAAAPGERIQLDVQTAEVLAAACRLSALSHGVFDVTVGARMVARGLLPSPTGQPPRSGVGDWQDIALDDEGGASLRQPVWIDLGGIAKGYAVDRAIEVLRNHGITHACVNAGGDLRTLGEGPHRIAIATDEAGATHIPVLEVGEVAVATSSGRAHAASGAAPHVDGRLPRDTGIDDVATVVAVRCIDADALTKVVLALGPASAPLLHQYNAIAYLQDAAGHWTGMGTSL